MSQWINKFPIKPIYFCLLLVLTYFAIYTSSLPAYLGLAVLLVRLFWLYSTRNSLLVLVFLSLFAGFFLFRREMANQAFQDEPKTISAIVMKPDTIKVNGDSLSFRGHSNGQTYQAFYKIQSEKEKQAFQKLSDQLLLKIDGELSLAENQRNFSGFDYRAYLKTQGIYRVLKINQIKSTQQFSSLNPWDWLSVWRRKALVYIKENFPSPMSHYMTGLLFGDLDTDFAEMNELYSSLGIIHLFALSGMQVGYFMDGFRRILLKSGLKRETVDWIQLPFSFIYAGLTGFSVSVVRSLVQKLLSQFGVTKLDNFALTIMLLAMFMPNFLLTTGGVLSCAYAFVISVMDFEHLPPMRKVLAESLTISLGILPILIFYFSEFQPWSILLTFLFSVVFDLFMLPALTFIFALAPLLKITQVNVLFELLEGLIRWTASISSRPVVFGQPSIWMMLGLLITLGLLYDFRRQKKVVTLLSLVLALLFFLTKHPLQNEITVIDIGQGDSIFLRDWRGKSVLIDVGGRVEIGKKEAWQKRVSSTNAEKTLIPYLKSRGVSRLDVLVLTHTDTDHMGDMLEVAKHFSIKEIYVSKGSLTQSDFVEKLDRMQTKVHAVEVGDKLPIFDGALQVLYPEETGDGSNDDSVVLYGKFFGTSFLFTGDLEENGEATLMRRFPQLKVDVLKAGHHGSKGSSSPEFLHQLQPKIALISAGKNNRYKHPHRETLDRFENIQTQIFRTDEQGAIRFSGWDSWEIETVK